MAKFHGYVGFANTVETAPGVFKQQITEREYTGDFLRDVRDWAVSEDLNDDIRLSTRVSVVADPFASENVAAIKYAKFEGVKWRVASVERQHPRLILRLGGVYNG